MELQLKSMLCCNRHTLIIAHASPCTCILLEFFCLAGKAGPTGRFITFYTFCQVKSVQCILAILMEILILSYNFMTRRLSKFSPSDQTLYYRSRHFFPPGTKEEEEFIDQLKVQFSQCTKYMHVTYISLTSLHYISQKYFLVPPTPYMY